ncbi:MAG: hypothetical protein AAF226_13215, partial [Verrucomicrobiota bacterium]
QNLAKQHPEKVAELLKAIDSFNNEMEASKRAVGITSNPRTLVPREGVEGEEGFIPTLDLPKQ